MPRLANNSRVKASALRGVLNTICACFLLFHPLLDTMILTLEPLELVFKRCSAVGGYMIEHKIENQDISEGRCYTEDRYR